MLKIKNFSAAYDLLIVLASIALFYLLSGVLYKSLATPLVFTTWTWSWTFFVFSALIVFSLLCNIVVQLNIYEKIKWLIVFCVFLLTVGVVFFYAQYSVSDNWQLWLDEFSQLRWVTQPFNGDLLFSISKDSQPPLAYPIYGAMIEWFGPHVISLKLPSLIFAFFTAIGIFLFSLRLTQSFIIAGLCSLVFVMHPEFVHHAQEARVQNQLFFFLVFYLFSTYEYLTEDNRKHRVTLFVSTFCLILSSGMQPPIIVSLVCLISIATNLVKMGGRTLGLVKVQSLAVLFAFPTLIQSLFVSADLGVVHTSLNVAISKLNLNEVLFSLKKILTPLMIQNGLGLIVVLILSTFFIARAIKDKTKTSSHVLFYVTYLALPIYLILIFKLIVNYELHNRYFLNFYILTICLVPMLVAQINKLNASRVFCRSFKVFLAGFFIMPIYNVKSFRSIHDQAIAGKIPLNEIINVFNKSSNHQSDCLIYQHFNIFGDIWFPSVFLGHSRDLKNKKPESDVIIPLYAKSRFRTGANAESSAINRSCKTIYWVILSPTAASLDDQFLRKLPNNYKMIKDNRGILIPSVATTSFYKAFVAFALGLLRALKSNHELATIELELAFAAITMADFDLVRDMQERLNKRVENKEFVNNKGLLKAIHILNQVTRQSSQLKSQQVHYMVIDKKMQVPYFRCSVQE